MDRDELGGEECGQSQQFREQKTVHHTQPEVINF